jgi:hypothetical protein
MPAGNMVKHNSNRYANSSRSYLMFATVYQKLLQKYHGFIPDSRLKGLSISNLKIIDSSTISLFGDILRGVGCPGLDGAQDIKEELRCML